MFRNILVNNKRQVLAKLKEFSDKILNSKNNIILNRFMTGEKYNDNMKVILTLLHKSRQ